MINQNFCANQKIVWGWDSVAIQFTVNIDERVLRCCMQGLGQLIKDIGIPVDVELHKPSSSSF